MMDDDVYFQELIDDLIVKAQTKDHYGGKRFLLKLLKDTKEVTFKCHGIFMRMGKLNDDYFYLFPENETSAPFLSFKEFLTKLITKIGNLEPELKGKIKFPLHEDKRNGLSVKLFKVNGHMISTFRDHKGDIIAMDSPMWKKRNVVRTLYPCFNISSVYQKRDGSATLQIQLVEGVVYENQTSTNLDIELINKMHQLRMK